VAVRCGFRDAAYFCRVFKRVTKTTPIEYRAKMMQYSAAPELEKAQNAANVVPV
jgi:AraC-like DNA-binding protein